MQNFFFSFHVVPKARFSQPYPHTHPPTYAHKKRAQKKKTHPQKNCNSDGDRPEREKKK